MIPLTSASPQWYAVHTKANGELVARDALKERGYPVFFPHHVVTVRHARRARTVTRGLYPRYLFADISDGRSFAGVNYAPGVSTVVHGVDGPLQIPAPVMDAEFARCATNGLVIEPECVVVRASPFRVGDSLRVVSGLLEGFLAVVRSVDKHGDLRIWLETTRGRRAAIVSADAVRARDGSAVDMPSPGLR